MMKSQKMQESEANMNGINIEKNQQNFKKGCH